MRWLLLSLPLLSACATTSKPAPWNPALRSVLVVPPLNRSPEVKAPALYLSTVTRPLAEAGYYVFPVAVVEAMLKENGLPTPGEMNQVSPQRLAEVFGADLILYGEIEEWGTTFMVLNSRSQVTVSLRMVDPTTNQVLWTDRQTALYDSSSSSGGQGGVAVLVALVATAVVNQVASSVADPCRDLAAEVNQKAFHGYGGLPPGPYLLAARKAER